MRMYKSTESQHDGRNSQGPLTAPIYRTKYDLVLCRLMDIDSDTSSSVGG